MDVLRLDARPSAERLERCTLDSDLTTALRNILALQEPTVLVVSSATVHPLLTRPELIVDRGTKHHSKPLARSLLRQQPRIPLIRGLYSGSGRVRQSVGALMRQAKAKRDANAYIIVIEPHWFDALRAKAPGPAAEGIRVVGSGLAEAIRYHVPDEVKSTYLGISPAVGEVWQGITLAAMNKVPVLILGETGTGKELVAWLIHSLGELSGAYVPINCAGLPTELAHSALFGHTAGAFTGANTDKLGAWRAADGGTLFLDEIGDMTRSHQRMFLRAIETKTVTPLGASVPLPVDARIVAATNQDVEAQVADKQFRADLYHRLRVYVIRTPSLAERPEDIPILADRFWSEAAGEGAELPQPCVEWLVDRRWPGNVRELQNFLLAVGTQYPTVRRPSVSLLEAVRGRLEGAEGAEALSATSYPGSCFRAYHETAFLHLQAAVRVNRAAKVTLRPLFVDKARDSRTVRMVLDGLRRHLDELESLTIDPNEFFTWSAFDGIRHVKGQLTTLAGYLEEDVEQAQRFWDSELLNEHKSAEQALFAARYEVEHVAMAAARTAEWDLEPHQPATPTMAGNRAPDPPNRP